MAGLSTVRAASEGTPAEANPYSVISDRNVFHLNPPPPPPSADDAKPVDLPKVILTGIVGKGTTLKVLLAIPPKDSKDFVTYLTLVPGQREHDVELVKIHAEKEEVEIINSGTAQTLSSKSNSYAAMAVAPHPGGGLKEEKGVPGLHRQMNPGFPRPVAPGPSAEATQGGGSALIVGGGGDSRSQYGGSSGGAFVSGGVSGAGAASYGASGTGVPGQIGSGLANAVGNNVGNQIAASLLNSQNGHYQMPSPTAPPLPPDVQGSLMVLHKAAMDGAGPPLPPPVQAAVDGLEGQPPPEGPPTPP
jgi:hypothetical protein